MHTFLHHKRFFFSQNEPSKLKKRAGVTFEGKHSFSPQSVTYCQPSCSFNGMTHLLGYADNSQVHAQDTGTGWSLLACHFGSAATVNNGSETGWESHRCGGMGSCLHRATSPLISCQRPESFIISLQVFGLSGINFLVWREVRVNGSLHDTNIQLLQCCS